MSNISFGMATHRQYAARRVEFVCAPVGGWLLLAGSASVAAAGVLAGIAALRARSRWLGAGGTVAVLTAAAMHLFSGVFTLPGCSGV